MYLAEKTVKHHVSAMLAKLGMKRRTQAAVFVCNTSSPDEGPNLRGPVPLSADVLSDECGAVRRTTDPPSEEDTMSTQSSRREGRLPDSDFVHPEIVPAETTSDRVIRYTAAALRLSLGWIFLWAFLDKTFGLGHETTNKDAWIQGGSPTKGFLSFAAIGPFDSFYHSISGQAWADWLFMLGLLGIGLALIAGVTMRIATACGVVMLVLMWSAVLPPANNLVMDDHLIYAMVLILLAAVGAGRTLGLGRAWESVSIVKRHGWLR